MSCIGPVKTSTVSRVPPTKVKLTDTPPIPGAEDKGLVEGTTHETVVPEDELPYDDRPDGVFVDMEGRTVFLYPDEYEEAAEDE